MKCFRTIEGFVAAYYYSSNTTNHQGKKDKATSLAGHFFSHARCRSLYRLIGRFNLTNAADKTSRNENHVQRNLDLTNL